MSSLSSVSLPKPVNWQDFERCCRTLFASVLGDPNAQMNGRSGQNQHGVDIWGTRAANGNLVGIQCKKKSEEAVTEDELKDELKKAKEFLPPIQEFILVTTAPRDAKIQRAARELTEALRPTDRPIVVAVWGWEDVQEHAANSEDAWLAFDPTHNPFAKRANEETQVKLDDIKDQLRIITDSLATQAAAISNVNSSPTDENTPLHGKITAYFAMLGEGEPEVALRQLEKLRSDEWSRASASERYRLLVALGSAHLGLGEYAAAGELLVKAYDECPNHKNASVNQAKGWLVLGDRQKAHHAALSILQKDSNNKEAASIALQTDTSSSDLSSALAKLPLALRDTEEVIQARVEFLRARKNPEWIGVAMDAARRHPSNGILQTLGAEGVLETALQTDGHVLAGNNVSADLREQIEKAADTLLDQATKSLARPSTLSLSTAYNAALSLRLVNREADAVRILDRALEKYPKDERLRFQRAVVALSEDDSETVLRTLPEEPVDLETICLRAEALNDVGKPNEALELISRLPEKCDREIQLKCLSVRLRAHQLRGESEKALELINRAVADTPTDPMISAVQARVLRTLGLQDEANTALDTAIAHVDEATPFDARVQVATEASAFRRYEVAVRLLQGRVNTSRQTMALDVLLASAMNGQFYRAAKDTLSSLGQNLRDQPKFLRAATALAINTGDPATDGFLTRYLEIVPDDVEMLLVRAGRLLASGKEAELRTELSSLDCSKLRAPPELLIRFAGLLARYYDAKQGLALGYKILLENWDKSKVHLGYHAIILLNEHIAPALPANDTIAENYVAEVRDERGDRLRYRIEAVSYPAFSDERVRPDSDLARILGGKKVGERVQMGDGIGAKTVEVLTIKHIYLDALHRSMQEFNTRFPNSTEFLSVHIDPNDPLKEIGEFTKNRAEAIREALERYEKDGLPLIFVAPMVGKDPLDLALGLPTIGRQIRVCRGSADERAKALEAIAANGDVGCVVDATTALILQKLGLEDVVRRILGPIYTTQSTIDVFVDRAFDARSAVGRGGGQISWQDGRLIMHEDSPERVEARAVDCERELAWLRSNCEILVAIPGSDLPEALRTLGDMFPKYAVDPIVAAHGHRKILLSDDMGYRVLVTSELGLPGTWIQPVLMKARDRQIIDQATYAAAVGKLLALGETYVTVDANCLYALAQQGKFEITEDLQKAIATIGGPSADLSTNIAVGAAFIDLVKESGCAQIKWKAIVSAVFSSLASGRSAQQEDIVLSIIKRVRGQDTTLIKHTADWLIGHSIGTSDLATRLQQFERRKSQRQAHPNSDP